jgi:hypothetical protein
MVFHNIIIITSMNIFTPLTYHEHFVH